MPQDTIRWNEETQQFERAVAYEPINYESVEKEAADAITALLELEAALVVARKREAAARATLKQLSDLRNNTALTSERVADQIVDENLGKREACPDPEFHESVRHSSDSGELEALTADKSSPVQVSVTRTAVDDDDVIPVRTDRQFAHSA